MAQSPAQPSYILRGHSAAIHSTSFIRSNTRLVTGDADGWIAIWDLATKRATAVWRAHEAAILGIGEWGRSRVVTHGKDNKLVVWKMREEDEVDMSKTLPVDDTGSGKEAERKMPWILHILEVNTLNFCSFASCRARGTFGDSSAVGSEGGDDNDDDGLLIAVPNAITSEAVDIFHLPSSRRLYTVSGPPSTNTGMLMAVAIFYQSQQTDTGTIEALTIVSGFESGHTAVVSQRLNASHDSSNTSGKILYTAQPHSQPILSLAVAPDQTFYLTSGADATVAKHPIPAPSPASALSQSQPLKINKTKHSGQQSITIRSDARIFATAGWDARLRVYAVGSLKELAVLKWHREGCFAVALADVDLVRDGEESVVGNMIEGREDSKELVPRVMGMTVKEKRLKKTAETHWLAAGSKDGKVSLWEIY